MNIFENENSLSKNLYNTNQENSKNISLFNLKLIHKILNSINISLLILIFMLSFISFKSQRNWTIIYKNLAKTRSNNNNLIDYISKTEEFFINEVESLNTFKKTTPKDLIYLDKQIPKQKKNELINNIRDGLKDSQYQRGY
ncbi:hypothetical protein P9515_05811 [Prochlorococcus marinus str. MIT 9515]|uniref:Uncharacterized protein n=2 Tax=Prochlorococcus marinus TaxID=1219 RepID=A2BVH9_PROM5|nr:hypothetical protein P9515_05811 [Prochlorococcus marinus str. MIT 9515]